MTTKPTLCASAAVLALSACLHGCIVPPSMFERASWGPPPEYWQEQGRYRQTGKDGTAPAGPMPEGNSAAPLATNLERTDPMQEGAAPGPDLGAPASEPPLYAWDGGVVDGAPQGRVSAQDGTPRGLETPPAGRMHIIELYQQVLDERDALAEEVELLRKDLEMTSVALEAKTREYDELTLRLVALESAHQALVSDNQSIAARLVQAQIRRLEAEKLLLETRIESERARSEEAARAAAAHEKASAVRPRPSAKTGDGGGHE